MRRVLTFIVMFLMIGAALNVAMAWACARWADPRGFDPQLMGQVRRQFFAESDGDPTGRQYWVDIAYPGFGTQFIAVFIDEPDLIENAVTGPFPFLGVIRAGWPYVALEARTEYDASRSQGPRPSPHTAWGVEIGEPYIRADRLFLPRILPLKPLWPGFAINTMLWAVALWLIVAVPLTLRRILRWHDSRCTACGYPIGVSPVCTECGRRVKRRMSIERPEKVTP